VWARSQGNRLRLLDNGHGQNARSSFDEYGRICPPRLYWPKSHLKKMFPAVIEAVQGLVDAIVSTVS